MLEWTYSGVDFSLDGNGGPDCVNFLGKFHLALESVFIIAYALVAEIFYPWKRSICNYNPNLELRERFGRKLLLAGLCLIWGIEIGYKLSTRQLIFLMNPCHVVTLIQLVLLIAPPHNWVHFFFRIQTYLVSGATIAIIFPVLNTRHLPFEVASYYIHHVVMLITPFYLMRLGGIYNMEPLSNFHWGLLSLGCMRLYHYVILQPISLATAVNLDSVICPAVSDPFSGPWYRLAANLHQTAFILLHGKIYCFIGSKFFAPKVAPIAIDSKKESQMTKHLGAENIDANFNNIEQIDNNMTQLGNGTSNGGSAKFSSVNGLKNGTNHFGNEIKSNGSLNSECISKKVH